MKRVELKTGITAELNGTEVTIKHSNDVLYSGEIVGMPIQGYGETLGDLIHGGHVRYVRNCEDSADMTAVVEAEKAHTAACQRWQDVYMSHGNAVCQSEMLSAAHEGIQTAAKALLAATVKVHQWVEA